MKKISRKMNKKAGFTLAEALVVILILLMVTMIVAAGLPAAQRAYDKVVSSANAQVLLSTTVTRLREELSMTGKADLNGNSTVKSYTRYGSAYAIEIKKPESATVSNFARSEKGIWIQYSLPGIDDESAKVPSPELLVPEKAATDGLVTSFESITFDGEVFTVNKLKVTKDNHTLASLESLVIRPVGPVTVG